MPTENRSSNTEQMVSVPREWAENYAGLLEERCAYEASERVQALLAQPAAQHPVDVKTVICRDCFTEQIKGVPCKTCADVEAKRAAQPQGETVAWSQIRPAAPGAYWVRGNGLDQDALIQVIDDQGELRCNLHQRTTEADFGYGYAVSDLSEDFEWLGPLYTHPDAGEVERLRGIIRTHEKTVLEQSNHLAYMRAQLAERDALLREALCHAQRIEPMSVSLFNRIDVALSASAEPKCQDGGMCADSSHKCTGCARDERDERALFESAHVAKCFNFNRKTVLGMLGEYGNPYVQSTWEGWQARAALERKP
ncbi:hypothetical protein [Pseudomonas qingdaonensis]|uniref:hypothetical protein n=1 Tax=Pseudomonas qingdaonensis TaxID=2056231 RepID=UPI000C291547|nr:hypothetical protein [Pseudomonas qingdaonensis]